MCYSVTHDVHSSQPRESHLSGRRLPRRRPRGDPRRRLEPYDADRHRPPGRSQPDDALPPVARHPDPARRPDDPRVEPGRPGGRRPTAPTPSTGSRSGIVATVQALRDNALLRRIVDVDPEVLLPYLLDRRGRSQEMVADALAGADRPGPAREVDPARRPRRARPQPGARLPRLHPVGAHDVRPHRRPGEPGRRRLPSRHRAQRARAEVPRPMTTDTGRISVGLADIPESTDVLVIGLGITGAGVALDAASRGLSVVAVDAHDVAFGTSRWSSKLVHGGLRYLARGQVDVAHESAVERGILMQTTAPHLIRALPMLMPLTPEVTRVQGGLARVGLRLGDLLRLGARTGRETLPRPRRIGVTETLTLALRRTPGRAAWRAALLGRPARGRRPAGARGRPHRRGPRRPRAHPGAGQRADRHRRRAHRQPHRREPHDPRPRPSSTRPACGPATSSRRSGCGPAAAPTWCCARTPCPASAARSWRRCPGASNRFVFALPQPDETFYVGLTDEEVDEIPDVPEPPEEDIEFLLRRAQHARCARTYAATRSSVRTPDCVPCSTRAAPRPTSPASTRCWSRAPAS